jgi:hypothetical protein
LFWFALISAAAEPSPRPDGPPPALPKGARLAFEEDWSGGRIDPVKWYALRKKWGEGNNGVVPENVAIARDVVDGGKERNVLVCTAHGDEYDGPVIGLGARKTRVGGVLVSKAAFASGRFEIVVKVGAKRAYDGGPADPTRPAGAIPAIWTYGYRYARAGGGSRDDFQKDDPLYNPLMRVGRGGGTCMYWSELDFPEFGKGGRFERAMYNTFCQNRHHPELFDVAGYIDGAYHTLTTEWRTRLAPLDGVGDAQVVEHGGFFWVHDRSVAFERYLGNPLKKLGPDRYAVCSGSEVNHWIDGRPVARNTQFVPSMAAQLNLGIWLPDWAGPARWRTATISFGTIRVWQYDDQGDVRGILAERITDSFDERGRPIR